MRLIIAGLVSVVLAWVWQCNLRGLHITERLRVGFLVPVGEELIKYGSAIVFGTLVWPVYLIFGLGEGIYEALRHQGFFRIRMIAAGMFTHFFFGILFIAPVSPVLSLGFAVTAHLIWNNGIIKMNNE